MGWVEYLNWIWIAIFVIALVVELLTADLVSIWFSFGVIPSYILGLFNVPPFVQIIVFFVVTSILVLFTRPVVMKYFKTNEIKTNVDSIIGQHGIVTERITDVTIGAVKIKTQEWSAVSNETIDFGEHVRVLDVEGVKLIVKKID